MIFHSGADHKGDPVDVELSKIVPKNYKCPLSRLLELMDR